MRVCLPAVSSCSLLDLISAVHHQCGSRNECGLIACQVEHRGCNLRRPGGTLQQLSVQVHLPDRLPVTAGAGELLAGILEQRSIDYSWIYRICTDVVLGEVACYVSCQ